MEDPWPGHAAPAVAGYVNDVLRVGAGVLAEAAAAGTESTQRKTCVAWTVVLDAPLNRHH